MTPEQRADVTGRCPACGFSSLFVASGGYVTCRIAECPDPGAASDWLNSPPGTIRLTPAEQEQIRQALAAYRSAVRCREPETVNLACFGEAALALFPSEPSGG